MTNQQGAPEALRLAEIIEGDYCPDWFYEQGVDEAAAELRRLHAENAALQQGYDAARLEIDHLRGATKMMEPAGGYPPLPGASLWRDETGIRGYGTDPGTGPWYTAAQLHAYVDAARAQAKEGEPQ